MAILGAPCAASLSFSSDARAQSLEWLPELGRELEVYGIALSGGLALFSTFVALAYMAERKAWRRAEADLTARLEQTRAQRDRAEIFLSSEQQLFIAWDSPTSEPDIEGSPQLVIDKPAPRRVLAFGSWLAPQSAQDLEHKVDRLRELGEAFHLPLQGISGRHFDAEGRAVGGRAVLRLREVSGDRLELISLRENYEAIKADAQGLRALLEAAPAPVWLRDADGRLTFVNSAYAQAVEARDPADAVERQIELLDQSVRAVAKDAQSRLQVWRERVTAIVAGARHQLDVIQAPWEKSSASIALDRQEIENLCAEFEQQMQSHTRTLDELPSAIAIFDGAQRLVYRNAAYEKLWRLDPAFLDQHPTDGQILDRLRLAQRLPVEGDFRAWKSRLFEAYRSTEELPPHVWHMPDGRSICVKVTPNPKGGVTYLYDDISERYELESRFNALYRMQNETLQTLHEGVAVFGADGRLRFSNPAFAALWRFDGAVLEQKPRFETIAELCHSLHPNEDTWRDLRSFVTGLNEMRVGFTRRLERSDGLVLDLTAQPLPEGAALLTFVDVTNDVNVERALTERNKALMAAEKLRNDFIHHVSYELRSPLNNINGFVHLLGDETTGPLNPRQLEYLGYVGKSSAALLAIVDDILDLATIDEGAMTLDIGDVDARSAMQGAIEGVQDRLAEYNIELQIVAPEDVGCFRGDAKRVRQILFNLLSNAIGFSHSGQIVTLAAYRRAGEVVFKVVDRGRGIPPEVLERVFDPFESNTSGSRHRGVGLGLSIVRAFMELHGGKILIDSLPGEGTTVTCVFPSPEQQAPHPAPQQEAEEPPPVARPVEIDAGELMRAAAYRVQAQLDHRNVRLRLLPTSEFDGFYGDESQLLQALGGLLCDAIESTGSDQAITLAGFQRQAEVVFKVADRGGGVDKNRAHARQLIEANGGVMHVDAVPGEGAVVTCAFPSMAREELARDKG
ncbi:PAS domain-containing protein [Methylocystis heyeri]|uniref:histidine kinase n=2 Tax=Methylocystis heyeri TaxID=391905 RepID=A0A6B8KMB2_9HYPH|nr:PAS domain-containing protein [Methylocystis heyeri]